MRRMGAVFGALMALVLADAAHAQLVETTIQPAGDMNWSTTAGRTVGLGNTALSVEAGWPGIAFTYLHGVDERTDWGFHLGFNYGFEGTDHTLSGLNLAVPYRHTMGTIGDTAFAFEAQPGVSFYGSNGGVLVGVGGPIGMVVGFKLDPRLTVDVGADVPVLLSFSNPAGFMFGPQLGVGAEYLLERNLAVTVRFRVGPAFALDSAGTGTSIGVTTLVGLAYNIR